MGVFVHQVYEVEMRSKFWNRNRIGSLRFRSKHKRFCSKHHTKDNNTFQQNQWDNQFTKTVQCP